MTLQNNQVEYLGTCGPDACGEREYLSIGGNCLKCADYTRRTGNQYSKTCAADVCQ